MVNYGKAMIYKIVPKDNNDYCYIGSTCDFKSRKNHHKNRCNNPNNTGYNTPLYKHMRDNGGWEEYEMILIEYYPCETKLELHKRERECKEIYNDNLGCEIPSRTRKEYLKTIENKTKDYFKKYYNENKEKITQYKKEICKEKIECSVCKCYVNKYNMKRHTQSKKHQSNL